MVNRQFLGFERQSPDRNIHEVLGRDAPFDHAFPKIDPCDGPQIVVADVFEMIDQKFDGLIVEEEAGSERREIHEQQLKEAGFGAIS